MLVIPAIDLKDGQCVRLRKGAFDTVHQVAEDPLQVARGFQAAGAERLHLVDLDGARTGGGINSAIVEEIARNSSLQIELGGGLRTLEALDYADRIGVSRFVIGSAAVNDPAFLMQALERYGDRIVLGIDALDGLVRTAGWTSGTNLHFLDFAQQMAGLGVKSIIFTDIETDGMLSGPSLGSLELLRQSAPCELIASGGVSTLADLLRLKAMDLQGAIVGKALYTGDIDLSEAIIQCR